MSETRNCPSCGAQVPDQAAFCTSCGAKMQAAAPAPAPVPTAAPAAAPAAAGSEAPKGLAIASMVCGIVGFFFFPLILGIVAVALSVVYTKKGGASGMAKAGLILGIICIVLGILSLVACGGLLGVAASS